MASTELRKSSDQTRHHSLGRIRVEALLFAHIKAVRDSVAMRAGNCVSEKACNGMSRSKRVSLTFTLRSNEMSRYSFRFGNVRSTILFKDRDDGEVGTTFRLVGAIWTLASLA